MYYLLVVQCYENLTQCKLYIFDTRHIHQPAYYRYMNVVNNHIFAQHRHHQVLVDVAVVLINVILNVHAVYLRIRQLPLMI